MGSGGGGHLNTARASVPEVGGGALGRALGLQPPAGKPTVLRLPLTLTSPSL